MKKTTQVLKLFVLMCVLILCTACHKGSNTHLPLLVMPINNSDGIFHLNKSEIEYYDATVDSQTCSGTFLGKATILGGESKLKLPEETGLSNRSVAKIAYANKVVSAADIERIRCVRTTVFGTQNNKNYESNSVDFSVICSGICPDHCICTYDGKAENKKAFLTKLK